MERSRPPSTPGRPDVVADFEFESGCLFLVIANIGSQPAHSISTSFEPSFSGLDGCRRIPQLDLFENVGFLPPGKGIHAFVDVADSYFAREEPTVIRTDVSFQDGDGNSAHNRATHDLGIYRDLPRLQFDPSPKMQPDSVGVSRGSWIGHRHPGSSDAPTDGRAEDATFELYEDRAGEYRWRLVHANGNVIADSGEGYASKQKAKQGIESVRKNASEASIEDRT